MPTVTVGQENSADIEIDQVNTALLGFIRS